MLLQSENLFGHLRKFYKMNKYFNDFFPINSSCAAINFCLSSGLSALVVFVSFLCGILASAFYKYTITRENMLFNESKDEDELIETDDDR